MTQIGSDIHPEIFSKDSTPIASEISSTPAVQGELIDEQGATSISKAETPNYLSFSGIVNHLFSYFFGGVKEIFFSYKPKEDGTKNRPLEKQDGEERPTLTTAYVVDEDGPRMAFATRIEAGLEKEPLSKEEAAHKIMATYKQERPTMQRSSNHCEYDSYLRLADEVLLQHSYLSETTCQAAERFQAAAEELKNTPKESIASNDVLSMVWNSAKKIFADPQPESAAPNLQAELGPETFQELQTLMEKARQNKNGMASLDLSDKKFDPLFEKKFDSLRAGFGIEMRPQDIENLTNPFDRFNQNLQLLKDGLKRDLGIELFK